MNILDSENHDNQEGNFSKYSYPTGIISIFILICLFILTIPVTSNYFYMALYIISLFLPFLGLVFATISVIKEERRSKKFIIGVLINIAVIIAFFLMYRYASFHYVELDF